MRRPGPPARPRKTSHAAAPSKRAFLCPPWPPADKKADGSDLPLGFAPVTVLDFFSRCYRQLALPWDKRRVMLIRRYSAQEMMQGDDEADGAGAPPAPPHTQPHAHVCGSPAS